jgi:hypothetical protein
MYSAQASDVVGLHEVSCAADESFFSLLDNCGKSRSAAKATELVVVNSISSEQTSTKTQDSSWAATWGLSGGGRRPLNCDFC